jgi:hypothetical protein
MKYLPRNHLALEMKNQEILYTCAKNNNVRVKQG